MTARAKRAKKTKRAPTGTLKLDELQLQQLLTFLRTDPDIFRGTTPLTGVYREAERALDKLRAKGGAKAAVTEKPEATAEATAEKAEVIAAAVEKPEASEPTAETVEAKAAEGSDRPPVVKPAPRWWWPGASIQTR